jgi:amino acid transporter
MKFCRHFQTFTVIAFRMFRRKRSCAQAGIVYMFSNIGLLVYNRHSSWNQRSSTLKHDWPKHGGPTACAIVQQYCSTTLLSLRFHSPKNIARILKMLLFPFFLLFWNCINSKLRNLKLKERGEVLCFILSIYRYSCLFKSPWPYSMKRSICEGLLH